jgi:hypothetical protein|nr:MAG TPA: Head fiber protein [Crassvirales sp.]
MRKFAGIIESTTVAPPTNCLWIKGNDALYFTNGKWVSLLAEDSADRIELETKVDDLDKEVGQIKKDLSVFGSEQGVVELAIGNTPEIKAANLDKLKTIQSNDHTFFTDINYGYGTASWLPTTGGNALIITNEGHAVKYSIAADGEVTKLSEFTLGEYTLPKATKTTLGGIKAIINVANLAEDATIAQVVGAVNTLLGQFRNCGLIQL